MSDLVKIAVDAMGGDGSPKKVIDGIIHNKKMKDYINLFHAIVSDIHFWDNNDFIKKKEIVSKFLENFNNIEDLVEYFDDFNQNLSKKSLNFFLKGVSNL